MSDNRQHIATIIGKYLREEVLSDNEQADLQRWLALSPFNQKVFEEVQDENQLKNYLAVLKDQDYTDRAFTSFQGQINASNIKTKPPVHRVLFLRRWGWAAAVLVLAVGITTAIVVSSDRHPKSSGKGDLSVTSSDIPPGGEKAVLTLADGTRIILDEAVNGELADERGVKIVKLANGQIAYDIKGLTDKESMWNTMSTPAGGQYQVILPDGTKAWLNAASSITYPTAFLERKRSVKISGEVYFEVAKNKEKPFVVNIDGKSTVEVLGTSFNINSYSNEDAIKTTLVEGSVKVSFANTSVVAASSDRQQTTNGTSGVQSVILQPGQQAQISTAAVATSSDRQPHNVAGISVVNNPNLDQALAWKNGLFSFDNSDLPSVMRQLERWYDIKVKYQGNISDLTLRGEMYRKVNLSTVLDFLKKLGINVRLEGKTLIVL